MTIRSFAVPVVKLTDGFPLDPFAELTASRGEAWITPEYEEAIKVMSSVAPVTVTDIVYEPVVEGTRYQSSDDFVPVLVELALVNDCPFQVAEVIDPVPPMSWNIPAERTRRRSLPDVV